MYLVDLEKVYERVQRQEVWYCMRKSGVADKYVRVVQSMYEDRVTAVCCWSDRWVQGGGGITSRIDSEPFLICSGDGQLDG